MNSESHVLKQFTIGKIAYIKASFKDKVEFMIWNLTWLFSTPLRRLDEANDMVWPEELEFMFPPLFVVMGAFTVDEAEVELNEPAILLAALLGGAPVG